MNEWKEYKYFVIKIFDGILMKHNSSDYNI